MSSRFVSGGTIDSTGEVVKEPPQETQRPPEKSVKSQEWEAVQQELDAERKRREEHRAKAATGEEKSLYDILQENKAAKQAAFEEQSKLRNQFRALDDDEVGFLDEVREKQRQEEDRVRRETEEGLKAFRERQKTGTAPEADDGGAAVEGETEAWGVGKKRKRAKDKELKGVRRRVGDGNAGDQAEEKTKASEPSESSESKEQKKPSEDKTETAIAAPASTAKKGSALVGYGSDSSDDD